MKKINIVLIAVFCILVIIIPVILCKDFKDTHITYNSEQDNIVSEAPVDSEYYEEETTNEIKLSDSCEKVLATGSNKNGDFYELVANQEETYDSVKIEIGVIKNNEWLLHPTSDMPFIDNATGLLIISGENIAGKESVGLDDVEIDTYNPEHIKGTFEYIADGCFCIYPSILKDMRWSGDPYCDIIYNAESNKTFYNELGMILPFLSDHYGNQLLIQNRYSIGGIPFEEYRSDFYVLNTNTMKTKRIVKESKYNIVGPIGDGLFAVGDEPYERSRSNAILYFYNLKGKKIIDLTSYDNGKVIGVGNAFNNGQFSFYVENDAGTEFIVTIDKKGNVIDSQQK